MNPVILNEAAEQLHSEKYRLRNANETFRDAMNRVASALADNSEHYHAFREILLDQRFLPGGRIQSAMGAGSDVTAYNCFVSGTISDTMASGEASILGRAIQAAETMRRGGGIGHDFSTLRPSGDLIKKLNSQASGPVSFMQIFDSVGRAIASKGHRRGAQMGVLRIDHPDVDAFISAKQPSPEVQPLWDMVRAMPDGDERNRLLGSLQGTLHLTGFNISLGVTDDFMKALANGTHYDLKFGTKVYDTMDARALWERVMRSTWDWADPGVLFIDRINEMNNLYYCETIAATNPCGEQPLPPFGACLLGSFNLTRYVKGERGSLRFDFEQLRKDIPHVVRAMDNVVDRTTYPLHAQEEEAKSKRRMGLGVTGAANTIEALGHPYGEEEFCHVLDDILNRLANETYKASALLAEEKEAFPLYDRDKYMDSRFVARLDDDTRDMIAKHGIRNSHLLSIAPTGTISQTANNVSSGIEPVFAWETERKINTESGARVVTLQDYGRAHQWPHYKTSASVTVKQHVAVLGCASYWMDSAVSKTCNVPIGTSWKDFKNVYTDAYDLGCKGVTTYYEGGMKSGLLKSKDTTEGLDERADVCEINPATGERDCG